MLRRRGKARGSQAQPQRDGSRRPTTRCSACRHRVRQDPSRLRKLAKEHHPDANPAARTLQGSRAVDVLSREKRKEYDEVRRPARRGRVRSRRGWVRGFSLTPRPRDRYGHLFTARGAAGAGNGRGPQRGRSRKPSSSVVLPDAINGTRRRGISPARRCANVSRSGAIGYQSRSDSSAVDAACRGEQGAF